MLPRCKCLTKVFPIPHSGFHLTTLIQVKKAIFVECCCLLVNLH